MSVNEKMTALADAIREKSGVTGKLTIDGMTSAVKAISSLIVASANGNPIVLNDSTDLRVQSLRLFGKTTQNGTPTPDAPVPLVSAGDGGSLAVTVAGKNLLPNNLTTESISGVQFIVDSDGSITANGTATGYADAYIYGQSGDNGNYLFIPKSSKFVANEISNTAFWIFREKTAGAVAGNSNINRLLKERDCHFYGIFLRVPVDATANNFKTTAMLCAETSDDIYEPYKQSQILNLSTPNGLPGIPVTSGGNYTDETGQQWVCDEVDFGRGIYVQRIFGTVFKSAVGWNLEGTKNGLKRFYTNQFMGVIKNAKDDATKECALCSHFINVTASDTWNEVTGISVNSKGRLDIYYSGIEQTTAALDVYFSSNPVAFMAELATPIETSLSAEELAAYAALHTNYPNTTILNDGGAGMEVKYVADTKNYIDNQIAAVAAAIVNA